NMVGGTKRKVRISCTSSGPQDGVDVTAPQKLATVSFGVLAASAGTSLPLSNLNVFDNTAANELASCNPTVTVSTSCANATVSTLAPTDSDGDGCGDGAE